MFDRSGNRHWRWFDATWGYCSPSCGRPDVPNRYGWTCFFCDETFTTPGEARDHFGNTPIATAGCRIKVGEERGLQMALRRAEKELASYRAEDTEKDRAYYRMKSEHDLALRRAEEAGYARGLEDAEKAR